MSEAALEPACAELFGDEGSTLSLDPNDRGNWTSGVVGQGELKGSKYGVSAMTYPDVDIANLTEEDAIAIVKRDWWDKYNLAAFNDETGIKLLDLGFNMGMRPAFVILQNAVNACFASVNEQPIIVDGETGPNTVQAANSIADGELHEAFCVAAAAHYDAIVDHNPKDAEYLKGWLRRAQE